VVGALPDGQSALNLAAAWLRHIAGTAWSTKRYLNDELLKDQQIRGAINALAPTMAVECYSVVLPWGAPPARR
jgi:hypothetical protein